MNTLAFMPQAQEWILIIVVLLLLATLAAVFGGGIYLIIYLVNKRSDKSPPNLPEGDDVNH